MNLLEKIQFDSENDRLWFTGNLINDRVESLEVLRFVHSLSKKAVLVLGNQELHLLQLADDFIPAEANDLLTAIQNAPDRDLLLKSLRRRPLIHHDSKLNFTLVHAGIPAEWSFSQALTFAYEVESVLSQTNGKLLLENLVQDQSRWHAKLRGWKRQRFIVNACTLMKYCTPEGKLDFQTSGSVHTQAGELVPWYRVPNRMTTQLNIIFSDEANFQDEDFSGIYPLSAQDNLTALKLAEIPERISVVRVEHSIVG
jgi:bis(5'-nucleosyl)-tetraphosphatase (symmetrical)